MTDSKNNLDALDASKCSFYVVANPDGTFQLVISDPERNCTRLEMSENQVLLLHQDTMNAWMMKRNNWYRPLRGLFYCPHTNEEH